jgi:GAF domain-containing protein
MDKGKGTKMNWTQADASKSKTIPIGWASPTSFRIPIPKNEKERLAALKAFQILDTPPEKEFDDITALAACICGTPIAIISLVDSDRQWFKSKIGVSATETAREIAFCAHAIMERDLFIIRDASKDVRFARHPFVTADPQIRFYAGAPLIASDDCILGTLSVADQVPREMTSEQAEALRILGRHIIHLLENRRRMHKLERQLAVQTDGQVTSPA